MHLLLLLIALFFAPGPAGAVQIVAVSPPAAPPGSTVTLTGGPFREGMQMLLGDRTVRPEKMNENTLTFSVPSLPEGDYALALRDGGKEIPVTRFRVLEPIPRIDALLPARLDACSIQQGRSVTLTGAFPSGTRVLLDGAVVPAEKTGETEIIFSLPALKGGAHQVETVTAKQQERKSLPHALFIDSVPRITSVGQGADGVTSYEVVVRGENFLYDSALVVNGTTLKQGVKGEATQNYSALELLGGEDYVRYVDCTTLIYVRHPLTREPSRATLQVVNPGGEQSPVYVVAIP